MAPLLDRLKHLAPEPMRVAGQGRHDPIRPLKLFGVRQERSDKGRSALNGDKDGIRVNGEPANLVARGVQAEVDGAANDGAKLVDGEPDGDGFPAPVGLGVRDDGAALGCPENA